MIAVKDIPTALRAFYAALPPRRRRAGLGTIMLMLIGALAEMLAVTAVLLFLTLLTDPQAAQANWAWIPNEYVGSEQNLFLWATAAFAFVMLASGAVRMLLIYQINNFAISASLDCSAEAFRRVISQDYRFYLENGSDQILSRLERLYILNNVVVSGVQAVIATAISVVLMVFLLYLDPVIAVSLTALMVGSYVATTFMVRGRLERNSRVLAQVHAERVKRIQQAVGGIRDILLDRTQPVFQHDFELAGERSRRPNVNNLVISNSPRVVIEVIGMVAIGALAAFLARYEGGLVSALPKLAALAVGAQRLLPLLQQAYFGWSQFFGFRETILEVAALLVLPQKPQSPLHKGGTDLRELIRFDDVSFAYSPGRPVLANVSFDIRKGERIGIVGETGSGKSTLTDLLLGLLAPTDGAILIDGEKLSGSHLDKWQAQIAHVPQSIYLTDDTVTANIAFGTPDHEIDFMLVQEAAQAAGIHDFIESTPEGYDTRCGERGIRLSGGQRQRIGIARALYKRANVLILDEATSALDTETEEAIIQSIEKIAAEATVIMVAHRISTLRRCNRILEVERGAITETSYQALCSAQATNVTP